MIPDLDIYRAVKLHVDQHGDDVPIKVAERVDDLLGDGYVEYPYIVGDGNGALNTVQHQLLLAGIRLAFLLDQNFGKP